MSLCLVSLSVVGLRSLLDLNNVPFGSGITVVCGRNGAGKSSLLEALEILLDDRKIVPADAFHRTGVDEIVVHGVFHDENSAPIVVRATLPPGRRANRYAATRVHGGFGGNPENLTLPILRGKFTALGIEPAGGTSKQPWVDAARDWIDRRPPEEFEDQWELIPSELAERLPQLTVFRTRQAEGAEGHVRQLVVREAQRLLADQYPDEVGSLNDNLNRDILPALERISTSIRAFSGLEPVITAVFDFSRPGADVQFRVSRDGAETSVSQIGDGNQQRLSLAVHAANLSSLQGSIRSRAEILAYDEPDTHLDYQSQRQLYDILSSQSDLPDVQVVVATHSTNFIDKVPLSSIVHVRQETDGGAIVDTLQAPTDHDEADLLERLAAGIGPRNSSLLGEPCFFVVEGQTEEHAVPILYRKSFGRSLLADGIALFNAQGSSALRSIVTALQQWQKDIVCLVDEDARSEPKRVLSEEWLKIRGFTEGMDLFFVGTKEFEDSFDDSVWCRTLNSAFPRQDGAAWEASQVAAIRDAPKFSSAIIELIRGGQGWAPGKPEVGEALASIVQEHEIPAAVLQALAEVRSRTI